MSECLCSYVSDFLSHISTVTSNYLSSETHKTRTFVLCLTLIRVIFLVDKKNPDWWGWNSRRRERGICVSAPFVMMSSRLLLGTNSVRRRWPRLPLKVHPDKVNPIDFLTSAPQKIICHLVPFPTTAHPCSIKNCGIQGHCGTPHWLSVKGNCTSKSFVDLAQVGCTPIGNYTPKYDPDQIFCLMYASVHPIRDFGHPGNLIPPTLILAKLGCIH